MAERAVSASVIFVIKGICVRQIHHIMVIIVAARNGMLVLLQ